MHNSRGAIDIESFQSLAIKVEWSIDWFFSYGNICRFFDGNMTDEDEYTKHEKHQKHVWGSCS